MDFSEHVALSLPVGAAVALASGRPEAGLAFAVGGILIDLDHLPDFWREKGHTFSLPVLNAHFASNHADELILALHGWELCGLVLALWAGFGLPFWVGALGAGLLTHLLLDQRYNLLQPWAYWFFARHRIGFKAQPLYLDPRP